MNLDAEIEAVLYYKNEPISLKKLSSITGYKESDVKEALSRLDERLRGGGLVLITMDDSFTLGTSSDLAPLIEKMVKEDLSRDLGKSAIDTLTIVLYYGPISKVQIDSIRGVNSGFILRNLLVRGLVERATNEHDQRSYIYKPTIELLSYLGIKNINELPEYKELRESLDKTLIEVKKTDQNEGTNTEA